MARALYLVRVRMPRRRGASLVAALLVMLVGGGVLSTLAAGRRTQSAYQRLVDETRVTNGFAMLAPDPDAQQGQIDAIAGMPEVDGWSHVQLVPARVLTKEAGPDSFIGVAIGKDQRVRNDVERVHIVEGRAADPDAPFEVVLGEARADVVGVKVGDDLPLATFTQKQVEKDLSQGRFPTPAGQEITLRVVGLERGPRQIIADQESENDITPLTPAFSRTVSPLPGYFADALIFRVPDERDIPRVIRRINNTAELKEAGVEFTTGRRVVDATDLVARALYAFALVSAICGTIALALLFARRISANLADDETLAAMGLTRAERGAAAVLELVPAIFLGAVGALVAALIVSYWMPFGFAGRVEPHPGFDADWVVLFPGALALFAGSVLLTVAVASRTIGVVRPAPRRVPLATRLAEAARARPATAAGLRMALERGRGARAVPVGMALAGAVLVIVGVTGALTFGASLRRMIDEPRARGFSWDVEVTIPPEAQQVLVDDTDIAHLTAVAHETLTIDDVTVDARGLETLRGAPPDMVLEGRAPAAVDEIALGRQSLREMDADVGDVVHVVGVSGTFERRVVGIAVFGGMDDDPALGEGAMLTMASLEEIVREPGADPGSGLEGHGDGEFAVGYAPGVDATAATARLNERLNPDGYGTDAPKTPVELRRLQDVRGLPAALAIFIGVLGVIAIGYAFVTAVQRRRADLAMHKALGMTRAGVRAIVLIQATTTVLIGVLVGVPLGLLLARLVWRVQVDNLGARFVVVAPALLLAGVCLAALVLANVSSLLPARRAVRMRAATVLRTE
jgi:ABC-type lipoprotein release transport system permease subunit